MRETLVCVDNSVVDSDDAVDESQTHDNAAGMKTLPANGEFLETDTVVEILLNPPKSALDTLLIVKLWNVGLV